MRNWLAMLVLVGCAPTPAVLGDEVPADTDVESDADTDSDTDADTDSDTDADTDSDTDADTDTDAYPLHWDGDRHFVFYDACEGSVTEEGIEVTKESDWSELVAACDSCDHVFYVEVSPSEICDGWVRIASEVARGVEWRADGSAQIWNIRQGDGGSFWAEPLSQDSEVDGDTIRYAYAGVYYEYEYGVQGSVTLW